MSSSSAYRLLALLGPFLACGCISLGSDVPDAPPPLVSMEEPPALFQEPRDEGAREALPLGGYTGVHVTDGRTSLSGLSDEPEGVLVERVVENSPGDAAGVREGDLLLAVTPAGGSERRIRWPSEWRRAEREANPGSVLAVRVDRAGVDDTTRITVAPCVRPPERKKAERFREEQRVGVVLRTATEVEADVAGLGAGGGAVIVGMARESPWRAAGLRFGDLISAVDGKSVAHPQVLLDAIRNGARGGSLHLVVYRRGNRHEMDAPLSRREREARHITVPPLFTYGAERGRSQLSILLGLFYSEKTAAAWRWRVLWLFSFGGGDADRLEKLK